jgi:sirohydrochlorin cobaltochelatase
MTRGLILFAHGAREPGWADPFEQLTARVRKALPDTEVRLAFLEIMRPEVGAAAAELVGAGADQIRVVPIFFGQGGHLRRDLPALIEALRTQFPGTSFDCAPAVGEDAGVLDAITAFCVRQMAES